MKQTLLLLTVLAFVGCTTKVEEITNPYSGELILRYEYKLDKDNQKIKHGSFVEWNDNGKKIVESNYKDGVLHGGFLKWNDDGVLLIKVNYKDGELHGEGTKWNADGTLSHELNFLDGKLDGENIGYFDDSIVKIHNYKFKQLNGPHIVKKINGNIITKGEFKDDKPVGTWEYFDTDGKEKFKLHFNNGACQELIGKWRVKRDRSVTYSFFEDGTYEIVKMALGSRVPIRSGDLSFSNKVLFKKGEVLVFVDYGGIAKYDIESIEDNEIQLAFEATSGRKIITLQRID